MFSNWKAPKSDRKVTKSGRKIRFSFFMIFFEFLNFENEKFEISPEFVSRTQPVTVNFPVNRIYRPKFFSLAPAATPLVPCSSYLESSVTVSLPSTAGARPHARRTGRRAMSS